MIHIVGHGALGCLWASYLADQQALRFIDTRPQSEASSIQFKRHLAFAHSVSEQIDTTHHFSCLRPGDLSGQISTLLLCTKSYATLEALAPLMPYINEQTQIYLFQNGLGSQYALLNRYPHLKFCAAVSTEGAYRDSDGTLVHAGKGQTFLGWLNPRSESCEILPAPQLEQAVVPDIAERLWRKLAINCAINPFTAILRCRNGEITDSDLFRSLWQPLLDELSMLLNAQGIASSRAELREQILEVIHKTGQNYSSMCQDVLRGRPTEIDDINGFAWQRLQRLGLPYRANHTLWEQVRALGH